MKEIVPFIEQINGLSIINKQIRSIADKNPEKAYIIANRLKKTCESIEKDYKEGFKNYYDTNKEIPGGFDVKVSQRVTYDYSVDEEWSELSEKLKAREEILKNATDQQLKDNVVVDKNGEIIYGVPTKTTEVYSISKK